MMKEFPTVVALTLASGGIGLPGQTFGEVHGAITYVIGWDVFTHELAQKGPWLQAMSNIHVHSEPLKRYGEELATSPQDYEDILARCIAEIGESVILPEGHRERTEHPLQSAQRMFPDKPVIGVQVP